MKTCSVILLASLLIHDDVAAFSPSDLYRPSHTPSKRGEASLELEHSLVSSISHLNLREKASKIRDGMASLVLAHVLLLGGPPAAMASTPAPLQASVLASTTISGPLNLRPATEEQPQITLPAGAGLNPELLRMQQTTLGGLIYLADTQQRPYIGDNLFITVQRIGSDRVLAGARIPMTKVKFPFQFSMGPLNVKSGVPLTEWTTALKGQDLMVQAFACPTQDVCPLAERTYQSSGISKWLSNLQFLLPSDSDQEGAPSGAPIDLPDGIRAAASLALTSQQKQSDTGAKSAATEVIQSLDDF